MDDDTQEAIEHPFYYGGEETPYEAIKVIEAWGLGFCLGNTIKYICRAGKKGNILCDLRKARWYLDREIQMAEKGTHQSAAISRPKRPPIGRESP